MNPTTGEPMTLWDKFLVATTTLGLMAILAGVLFLGSWLWFKYVMGSPTVGF